MTLRSVFLGLALGAVICGVTFFNDMVLRGTFLVGNYLPISVFGGLLILVLVANPLLRLLSKRTRLQGRELAVIVALALVACCVPGRGLMHYFTTFMMLPHERARTYASWKAQDLLATVPPQMLADATEKDVADFMGGLGEGDESIAFSQIPWHVWQRPLMFWIPLLLSLWIGTIALAVVLHRQWSVHERLQYPIVTFANALLPDVSGRTGSALRNRAFWVAAGIVVVIHLNNYASTYYPQRMFQVPLAINLSPLAELFRDWKAEGDMRWLMSHPFRLTAVGFAYLLSTDLSLSLGIAPYAWAFANGIFTRHGVQLTGSFFAAKPRGFIHAGAFMGLFLVILYSGRRYLSRVFGRAMLLPVRQETTETAVWAARAFLVAMAAFVLQLTFAGVYWPLAILYAIGALVIYTVISRIVAETGTFFIHAYHFPCVILLGFLGLATMDMRSLTIMFLVSSLAFLDPREAAMPFMMTGLKLVELSRGKIGRTGAFGVVALLVAFAVAVPVTLYIQYDKGARNVGDGWTLWGVPFFALNSLSNLHRELEQDPELASTDRPSGMSRFLRIDPDEKAVTAFVVGLGLVLLFSAGRLRFPWWPIHPVLFVVLGTFQSSTLSASFLLGWLIKVLVTRLFGGKGYQGLKPFMIGLIAGDILGGILPMVHGAIYYYVTNTQPMSFRVLPT